MNKTKSFDIPKQLIWRAYKQVSKNKGAAGVDEVSITKFEENLKDNLYKLWNRMSSGSYFPEPVKAVAIPKDTGGGQRILGVPSVFDRIGQTAAAMYLEPLVEPKFHEDLYGYRPNKSALDAVDTEERLAKCKLKLHPEKTQIVYCKDGDRRDEFPTQNFDFLGYTFRARGAKNKKGNCYVSFLPAISNKAKKKIKKTIKSWRIHRITWTTLEEISKKIDPIVRGWLWQVL